MGIGQFPMQGGYRLWKSGKPGILREFDKSGKLGEFSGEFVPIAGNFS
jgi:hypothetical protein